MFLATIGCAWIGADEHCERTGACDPVGESSADTPGDSDPGGVVDTAGDSGEDPVDTAVAGDSGDSAATDTGPPAGERRLSGEITAFDVEFGESWDMFTGQLAGVDALHANETNTPGLAVGSPSINGTVLLYAGPIDAFDSYASPSRSWVGISGTQQVIGTTLARAGDVDGDGLDEIVVGQGGTGYVAGPWLVFEPGADLAAIDTFAYDIHSCCFSHWADPGGDLDGDGYAEVVLNGNGAVVALSGGATASTAGPAYLVGFWGADGGDAFGTSASVADLEGDDRPEVVIGAPFRDSGATEAGSVYVVDPLGGGGTLGTDVRERARIDGSEANLNIGSALSAGDVDGNGTDDVLFQGWAASWLVTDLTLDAAAPAASGDFGNHRDAGNTMRIGGDADLDGRADIAAWVGCAADAGVLCAGIFYGPAADISTDPDAAMYGGAGHAGLTFRTTLRLDDVSGDGAADLVVALDNAAGDDRFQQVYGVGIALGGRVE